jgi:hypothetical protein
MIHAIQYLPGQTLRANQTAVLNDASRKRVIIDNPFIDDPHEHLDMHAFHDARRRTAIPDIVSAGSEVDFPVLISGKCDLNLMHPDMCAPAIERGNSIVTSRFSSNASGLVTPEHEPDLHGSGNEEQAGKSLQPKRIIRDPLLRQAWVNFGLGALAGIGWCLFAWLWNK